MRLDHLVILASDLELSIQHYDAVLGALDFEKTRDWVWWHEGAGVAVELRAADEPQSYKRYAPGLNHFAFAAESLAELDLWAQKITAAGLELPPHQSFGEARAYFLPDPDGLRIELAYEPH